MSCMEHICANPKCDFITFDNCPSAKGYVCPNCGGNKFHSHFDEEDDHPKYSRSGIYDTDEDY